MKKSKLYTLIIITSFIAFTFTLYSYYQLCSISNTTSLQQTNLNTRLLLSQPQSSILQIFSSLLNLVSSMVNILKRIFQLTALLFLIQDLVNFWNLATIYIFLPQIDKFLPQFCLNKLIQIWNQFNQPILEYFNIQFKTINLVNNQQIIKYSQNMQYKQEFLNIDVTSMTFQPVIILIITGVQLIIFKILLNKIKKWFKNVQVNNFRQKGNQQLNNQNQNKLKQILKDLLDKLINNNKSNKVSPLNQQNYNQQLYKNKQLKRRCRMRKQKGEIQQKSQSFKNIFLQQYELQLNQQQQQSQIHINNLPEPNPPPTLEQITLCDQLPFCSPTTFLPQPQTQHTIPNDPHDFLHLLTTTFSPSSSPALTHSKHWTQSIKIDVFEILSALIINFMPVLLLPLYNCITRMKFVQMKGKFNILVYLVVVFVIVMYPFIYAMMGVRVKVQKYKRKNIKINKIKSNMDGKNKNNNKMQLIKIQQQNKQFKAQTNTQTPKIINKNKPQNHPKQLTILSISFPKQTTQNLLIFLMNISLPICSGITSSPIYFLHINLFLHIFILLTQIFLYPSKSCQSKFTKFNQIIQKMTFLLYHLCFYVLYFFNISSIKQILINNQIINDDIIIKINQITAMMIIILFTCGGMHEMIQFLIKIIHDLFKILYMILIVITGGYEVDQKEIKLNSNEKGNNNFSDTNMQIYKQFIDKLLSKQNNKQSNQQQKQQQPQRHHKNPSPLKFLSIFHPTSSQQSQSQNSDTDDIELVQLQQKIKFLQLANKFIKLSEQKDQKKLKNIQNNQNQLKINEKQLQLLKKTHQNNRLKANFCNQNKQIRSQNVEFIEKIQNNNNEKDPKSLQLIMFFQPGNKVQEN